MCEQKSIILEGSDDEESGVFDEFANDDENSEESEGSSEGSQLS